MSRELEWFYGQRSWGNPVLLLSNHHSISELTLVRRRYGFSSLVLRPTMVYWSQSITFCRERKRHDQLRSSGPWWQQKKALTGSYVASRSGVDPPLKSPYECTPPCTSLPMVCAAAFGFAPEPVLPCGWSNLRARFALRSCSSERPGVTPLAAGVVGTNPLNRERRVGQQRGPIACYRASTRLTFASWLGSG